MILYHGSTVIVKEPAIRKGDVFLDFGVGFYTTKTYAQAERWTKIKMRRSNTTLGYISIYEFDLESAKKLLTVKEFKLANEEWLSFVVDNRNGRLSDRNADLIVGPVADDNVYQTIRFFETGAFDAEYTIRKLKTEVLHDQWVMCSESVLKHLQFIEAKEIR